MDAGEREFDVHGWLMFDLLQSLTAGVAGVHHACHALVSAGGRVQQGQNEVMHLNRQVYLLGLPILLILVLAPFL